MIACAIGGINYLVLPFLLALPCLREPYRLRCCVIGTEFPVVGQQRPDNSGILVGQCDRCHILVAPRQQMVQPPLRIELALRVPNHRSCPMDQQRAQIGVTALI